MKSELKEQIESHHRRNLELIEVLKDHGLKKEDWIEAEYHFWVNEHNNAVALAKQLYDESFVVIELAPVEGGEGDIIWNLEVRKHEQIKDIISPDKTVYFVNLASKYGGTYDGWGTAI